jgi:hypothetical protein
MSLRKTFILFFLFSLLGISKVSAKENDFGVWLDLAATRKFHSATFGLISEIYTKDNSSTFERLSIGLKGDYALYPWLSAGTGYILMDFFRAGYRELSDRFYFQAVPSWHYHNFSFSFRERMQITLYPETRTNGPTTYYWRNRFEASYKKNAWKWEPLIDLEQFYRFGDFSHNLTDGYRIIVGTNYCPSPNQKIKIYGMLTDGSIVSQYVFGVAYEIKL